MEYFIKKIYFSNILSDEQKIDLILKIIDASLGMSVNITPDMFLRVVRNNYDSNKSLQLWQRCYDENNYVTIKNTGCTIDEIIDVYLRDEKNDENKKSLVLDFTFPKK